MMGAFPLLWQAASAPCLMDYPSRPLMCLTDLSPSPPPNSLPTVPWHHMQYPIWFRTGTTGRKGGYVTQGKNFTPATHQSRPSLFSPAHQRLQTDPSTR
jgi:hypothetical protein